MFFLFLKYIWEKNVFFSSSPGHPHYVGVHAALPERPLEAPHPRLEAGVHHSGPGLVLLASQNELDLL